MASFFGLFEIDERISGLRNPRIFWAIVYRHYFACCFVNFHKAIIRFFQDRQGLRFYQIKTISQMNSRPKYK